jgi:XTP/dITP diphosphohydrolase
MKIVYVTGNQQKFEVARLSFERYGIELIQKNIETPEVQSSTTEEVAKYSAKWAANQLNIPVIVSDAGFYITALNGFPGPFIKYVNQWFTSDDYLRLMEGKADRTVTVKACYGFCEPGKEPVVFAGETYGTLALKPGRKGKTSINEVFIPMGYDKVESEIDQEEMNKFWANNVNGWQHLIDYLQSCSTK